MVAIGICGSIRVEFGSCNACTLSSGFVLMDMDCGDLHWVMGICVD